VSCPTRLRELVLDLFQLIDFVAIGLAALGEFSDEGFALGFQGFGGVALARDHPLHDLVYRPVGGHLFRLQNLEFGIILRTDGPGFRRIFGEPF